MSITDIYKATFHILRSNQLFENQIFILKAKMDQFVSILKLLRGEKWINFHGSILSFIFSKNLSNVEKLEKSQF
jgi:hypothetical protein